MTFNDRNVVNVKENSGNRHVKAGYLFILVVDERFFLLTEQIGMVHIALNVWTFVQLLVYQCPACPHGFDVFHGGVSYKLFFFLKVCCQDIFRAESGRCGLQEVEMLAEVKGHNDDAYRQDVLHKQECHTDTDRLAVRSDAPHGSNGHPIIISDVGIDGCQYRHDDDKAER